MVKYSLYVCLGIAIAMTGCWPKVFNKKNFVLYGGKSNSATLANGYYYLVFKENGASTIKCLLNNGFVRNFYGDYGTKCKDSISSSACQLNNMEHVIDEHQNFGLSAENKNSPTFMGLGQI